MVGLSLILLLLLVLAALAGYERILFKKTSPRAMAEGCWNGEERRRHVRFKDAIGVAYTVEKKSHLRNGVTGDISQSGLKLILDEKLSKGDTLYLRIPIPNSQKVVEAEAEVVWSGEGAAPAPSDKRSFQCGVKFTAVKRSSKKALVEYLRFLYERLSAAAA